MPRASCIRGALKQSDLLGRAIELRREAERAELHRRQHRANSVARCDRDRRRPRAGNEGFPEHLGRGRSRSIVASGLLSTGVDCVSRTSACTWEMVRVRGVRKANARTAATTRERLFRGDLEGREPAKRDGDAGLIIARRAPGCNDACRGIETFQITRCASRS